MRPPSAAQSRAGAVAPAPRGFPVVACPDSIARDIRCLLLTHTSITARRACPVWDSSRVFQISARCHTDRFGGNAISLSGPLRCGEVPAGGDGRGVLIPGASTHHSLGPPKIQILLYILTV